MTLTIVATPADATANAYVTLAEAEAYVATLAFSDAWTGKTDEQKKAAIISGARWMDTLSWKGMRSTQTQARSWPRCGSYTHRFIDMTIAGTGYLLDRDGYQIPTDQIPQCIKDANSEMAMRLLGEDRAGDAGALAPSKLKVGPLELEGLKRTLIPPAVYDLCGWLLETPPGQCALVRG